VLRQSVLPFKLEATDESLTSHAGLILFGESLKSLNLKSWIDRAFGRPGSGGECFSSKSIFETNFTGSQIELL
jgi:hypothetical protein